jgi:TatD DNase family protein
MFVDSHAHLFAKEFEHDLEDVLSRASAAGVDYIINPGTDLATSRRAIELAERYSQMYAAVGIHPHDASKADDRAYLELEELSRHPKVVAIGEIGLDYHYNFSPPEVQREVFARQLELAYHRGLPVIIHSREAEPDTLDIVEKAVASHPDWRKTAGADDRTPPPRGVFHCFPGDAAMAWRVIKLGFYVSLPGPVTYPDKPSRPNSMLDVARNVSCEHILLETDSPYLAPVPHRGKRNEPAHIPLVAARIAELQHLSIEDIARASSFGVTKLFGIGRYPDPAIVYRLRNSLYLNITLRCNADCGFCDRKGEAVIKGHNLRIGEEPSAEAIIAAIGDPRRYEDVVFCGYGEPTIRFDTLKDVAREVKKQGGRVRLNTDGHGSVINKRNIVPEMVGIVDAVSISLNSIDPVQYGELMGIDGSRSFPAMVEFAKECVRLGIDVTMTIVDLPEVDAGKARQFVEEDIGAKFRIRPFF